MSMHLLPAYYTSNNQKTRKKKKASVPSKHDLWLEQQGLHINQLSRKKRVDLNWREEYINNMKVDRGDYVSLGLSGDASSTAKRGVMANLHKESENVRKEILLKASRVMPLFNKGGLQYASPNEDMTMVGTKSRR